MGLADFGISVNGGGPQTGGIDVPGGATIDFVPVSTVGWKRVRWEIIDYPEGWATPAGWTLAASGMIYSTAIPYPPQITLPAASALFGVWMPRLLVNEQIDTDQNILPGLLCDTNAFCVLSPLGLRDIGAREEEHFTTPTTRIKKWLRTYQQNLRTIESAGLGGGEVQDDIARSTGNPADPIDRVQGFRGRALAATVPTRGETYYFDGTQFKVGKPIGPDEVNVLDYGAVANDNTADNTAAFFAACEAAGTGGRIYVPKGVYYFKRPWAPHKAGQTIRGAGPRGGSLQTVLQFAEASPVPLRGSAASISAVASGIATLTGGAGFAAAMVGASIVIHGPATGLNGGSYPIVEYVSATSVKYANPNAVAGDANNGSIKFEVEAGCGIILNENARSTIIKDLAVYGTDHWGSITARANSEVVALGALRKKPRNNAYFFECIQAGTTDAAPPAAFTNATQYDTYHLGVGDPAAEITDGTAKWIPRIAAGVVLKTHAWVMRNDVSIWTTANIHVQAGADEIAYAANTNGNLFKIIGNLCYYGGVGIFVRGNDANSGEILGNDVVNSGYTRQSLYTDGGTAASGGGHGFWDHSFLGCTVDNNHWGAGYGHPYMADGAAAYGAHGKANYAEGGIACRILAPAMYTGGNIVLSTDSTGGRIGPYGCQGLQWHDLNHAKDLWCAPVVNDGTGRFNGLYSTVDDPVGGYVAWGYQYNGVGNGRWALAWGNQNPHNAAWVSSVKETTHGPGWWGLPTGQIVGDRYVGTDAAITDKQLRGGLRLVGDDFRNATPAAATWFRRIITTQGYRGVVWSAGLLVAPDIASIGFFANLVEPTASHAAWSVAGGQVWKCTTGGTTGVSEPAWPGAPVVGVTTVADGTVVWTYAGTTPAFTDIESLP